MISVAHDPELLKIALEGELAVAELRASTARAMLGALTDREKGVDRPWADRVRIESEVDALAVVEAAIAADAPEPETSTRGYTKVDEAELRATVRRLGTFRAIELAEATGLSRLYTYKRINRLIEAGIVERVGKPGSKAVRYRYVKPTDPGPGNPPAPPPPTTSGPAREQGIRVNGRPHCTDKDIDGWLALAYAAGWDVRLGGSGHIRVRNLKGQGITVSASPSDRRARHRVKADLRRLGLVGV